MQRRELLGFAIAPVLAPVAVLVLALVQKIHIRESLMVAAIYVAFTYGTAILLGIPAFMIFRHYGWQRWWQHAFAGTAMALVVFFCIWLMSPSSDTPVHALLLFAAIGAGSATLFWLLAVRRNQNEGW